MNEPYVPRSPDLSALHANRATSNSYAHPHLDSYSQPQPQQHHYATQNNPSAFQHNNGPARFYKQSLDHQSYQQQAPPSDFHLPPSSDPYAPSWGRPQQAPHFAPNLQQPLDGHYPPYTMPRGRTAQADPDYNPSDDYAFQQQPYNGQPSFTSHTEPSKPPPGEHENIIVKTKFPVARIKRIVQADDEVGKVAQSTPVAVSKALELFMISLALGSANVARERGSKKVTGACLKAAVSKDEQFDFLSEIVSKIQDGGGVGADRKKGREASESEDKADEDSDEDYGASKRQKGAPRTAKASKRKKASESDDD